MRCLLIQITRTRRGQPIRDARLIEGDTLTIGRGSDCSINLPNPRVNLLHATLKSSSDGRLTIEAHNDPISVNGSFVRSARLRPDTRVTIGPYELVVELGGAEGYPEHDFGLTLELLHAASASQPDRPAMTLRETWMSRRIPAFLLALVIGALFLAFPILQSTDARFREATSGVHYSFTSSWNPGLLAAGHRYFANDCEKCHALPWMHVRDHECTACHEGTGTHIEKPSLQKAVFNDMRCAQCHRDHRGLASMSDIDPVMCVDCHAAIRSRHLDSALPDIRDFANDHPAFRLTVRSGPLPDQVTRIEPDQKGGAVQHTGLKFNHEKHLDERGIVSPNAPPGHGGRVVLECASCHVADGSGVGFKPVTMEKNCADCHRLEFEPDVSNRQVPHGSERNVLLMLREFYGSAALGTTRFEVQTVDGLLHQPNARASDVQHQQALAWATEKSRRVATDLFEVRVCVVCHDVAKKDVPALAPESSDIAVPWSIAPIYFTQSYMPAARFEHSAHAAVKCQDCHDVAHSKVGTDLVMPTIGQCRQCHAGAQPERHKIASNCELCHSFHRHTDPTQPSRMQIMLQESGGASVTGRAAPAP